MIVNKYPFSRQSSFSDVNELLEHDELRDLEKNLPESKLEIKEKEDNTEKYIKYKLIADIKKNCCVCLCSVITVTVIVLLFT